jgi:hypothetical protein
MAIVGYQYWALRKGFYLKSPDWLQSKIGNQQSE